MELLALDLMTQESIELLVVKGENLEPISCGTGCFVQYRDKFFILTVAHVTDYEETSTCIVLNRKPEEGKTPMYCVGTLNYFDEYSIKNTKLEEIKSLDDLLKDFNETIDITFCELKEKFEILQPEINFGFHKVEKSFKMFIDLEKDVALPNKDNYYGFCGNIRHNPTQSRLTRTITLKHDIKYHNTKGRYHMFLAPEVIKDADDYRGCSGAPILDNHGKFVGLAAAVRTNTKIILGVTIEEIKRLLNYHIDIANIQNRVDK
jgi:hypothetical protein